MGLKENIKRLREENNLTQEELGKMVGTTKQTIQRYESGDIKRIPYDRIVALARCFGVSPPVLMDWEENTTIIESVKTDVELINMEKRVKEYAIRLSKLSKENQDFAIQMIDNLTEQNDKGDLR